MISQALNLRLFPFMESSVEVRHSIKNTNPSSRLQYFSLYILHVVTAPMLGFANSLAYGFDHELRTKYQICWKKNCLKQQVEEEEEHGISELETVNTKEGDSMDSVQTDFWFKWIRKRKQLFMWINAFLGKYCLIMLTRFLNDMPMHYDSQVRYQICKFCLFNRTNPNIGCIFFRFFPVEHHNCNVIKNAVCIRRSPKNGFLCCLNLWQKDQFCWFFLALNYTNDAR